MVKGISRQVILVQSPETRLFEQAIFILKENAEAVSDDQLLREAKQIMGNSGKRKRLYGPLWACAGAVLTGVIWLFTIFL